MKLFEKMDLFKNKVGRPSNEIHKKRKMFYLGVAASVLIVIIFGVFTLNRFNVANLKGASVATCVFPYNRTKCQDVKNETVKKAHTMLKKLKYYSSTIDGMFGPKTEVAVKNFQKKENLTQNGNLNYETLNRLALRTSTRYYTVKYNRNGSSTSMSGAEIKSGEYAQSFIYGVKENLSKTKLLKKGYTHVGYTLSTSYYRVTYQYGCLTAKCDTGAKWYSETEILRNERAGKKFYPMVYNIGQTVSKLGSKGTGQTVTLTAKYCPEGQIYDKKTSTCQTQALKTDMTLKCPTSVTVNKEGVCTTNMSGVKITVTKTNLNNKYKSTYTTTSSDKTKVFMYTKTGTITIKAEKSGYKTVTKTVKIEKAANTTAATASSSKYSVTSAQYTTLVAVVCQEDSTGYTGAKAVIDTIFNRVDSRGFPNTTWKVVTARKQFAAYWNGHYKRRLNSNGTLKSECNNAKKAVDDAMAKPSNRSHNSLYFQDTKYITKGWTSRQIGANWYRTDSAGTLKK